MSLRERLQEKRIVLAPGVYDALSALLAERAGFEALYLSGASIAYTRHGGPGALHQHLGRVRGSGIDRSHLEGCDDRPHHLRAYGTTRPPPARWRRGRCG